MLILLNNFIFSLDEGMKSSMMRRGIFTIWMCLTAWVVDAATFEDFTWKHFTTEDGLSQNTVMDLLQDSRGYMWMATWDGLNRYDGYDFRSYKVRPGDDVYLTSSRIDKLLEDEHGFLWLLAYGKNVVRFDPKAERFTNVPARTYGHFPVRDLLALETGAVWLLAEGDGALRVQTDSADRTLSHKWFARREGGGPGGSVTGVFADALGNEWILTQEGLFYLDAASGEEEVYFGAGQADGQGQSFYCALEVNGGLWFGASGGTVWRYLKENGRFVHLQLPGSAPVTGAFDVGQDLVLFVDAKGMVCLYHVAEGLKDVLYGPVGPSGMSDFPPAFQASTRDVWVQVSRQKLLRYDAARQELTSYEIGSISNDGSGDPAFMMHEDLNGVLWVHPFGGGLFVWHPKEESLERFFKAQDPQAVFSDRLHSMLSDDQGNLWVGTRAKGLERFVFPGRQFSVLELNPNRDLVSNNDVRAVLRDSSGHLWVANKAGQLAVYDNRDRLLGFLNQDGWIRKEGRFHEKSVYSITEDAEGVIWIGTKGAGLFRLKQREEALVFDMEQFAANDKDVYSLSHNDVYDIHVDGNGNTWVATYGGGLNLMQYEGPGKARFINVRNHLTRYPILNCHRVRTVSSTSSGHIWVGTTHGLLVFDGEFKEPEEIQFLHYAYRPSSATSLSNNDVHSILETRDGVVYVATFGGGLNRLVSDPKDLDFEFEALTTENGLATDALLSLLEDATGRLWLATENGVSRFDCGQGEFRNFNKTDFSRVLGFSEGAGWLDENGRVLFGTNQGLLYFHPDSLAQNPYVPPLVFTDLRVLNKRVQPGVDALLKQHIDVTREVVLRHNQNIFSLSFAALEMKYPEAVRYAARLEGFDKEWVYLDRQRVVNYTNLPAGDFVLRVRSTNSDGVWMDNERDLKIKVQPSFWVTPLAYVLYLLVFLLIGGLAVYVLFSIYHLRQKMVVDREVLNMKLDFFTNISHELRTPLTLISGPLEQVLQATALPVELRPFLELVDRNTQRMLRLLNELLDFVKISNRKLKLRVQSIALGPFVAAIMESFKISAEQLKVNFELVDQSEGAKVWADADKLEKMVFNLLSNAFKYIDGGEFVKLTVRCEEHALCLEVRDDGPGLKEAERQHLFERFENTLSSGRGSGPSTGLGLALVKELVVLHGGSVEAIGHQPRGSSFLLRLPQGLQHFGSEVEILESPGEELPSVLKPGPGDAPEKGPVSDETCPDVVKDGPLLLLVEDNFEVRRFLRSVLCQTYQVLEAAHGQEALDIAREHLPDFIVSDLMMPHMNGQELLQAIRADFNTSHIPFILLTAKDNAGSRLEGIREGADDYITKPFSPAFLLQRIAALLEQRRRLQMRYRQSEEGDSAYTVLPDEPEIASQDEAFLTRLKELMEKNIENSSLVVEDLVGEMALSRSVFFKKLKALTGLAPIEYIREMRLQRSVQLIKSGAYNMTQIAYMVGLNDPRYFSKCFKQRFGCTPTEFRNKETGLENKPKS